MRNKIMNISFKESRIIENFLEVNNLNLENLKIVFDNIINNENINYNLIEEIKNLTKELFFIEMDKKTINGPLLIEKNSLFGEYLINNNEKNIINLENYISFEKIKNAMLIAIYEDDIKMTTKIMPLFQSHFNGEKKDLLKILRNQEWIINYINNNDNFDIYLKEINNEEINYYIYENGKINLKNLNEKKFDLLKK